MAKRRKSHKDVEFAVNGAHGGERIFKTFEEACARAVITSASGRQGVSVDVLIHSESGARWWGGDPAVEDYRMDPDASVSDRIEISVNDIGRVA